jgi:hypothetical protein
MAISQETKRDGSVDRRRRHASDPTVPITVNIDVVTLRRADSYVVASNGTRSGLIRRALNEFCDRQDAVAAEVERQQRNSR